MAPPRVPLLDRIADKFTAGDDCWEWTGAGYPYGMTWRDGRNELAHRAVYELMVGEIPEGMHLDHLCRNKLCVRPDHLQPVSPGENTRRHHASTTHCPQGHPYDEANTYEYPNSNKRKCRACRRKVAK